MKDASKTSVMRDVTDQSFEDSVLKSTKLVLVDFWALWCPPCLLLTPTLETVLQEQRDHVEGFRIDVDQNQDVPTRYAIRGMPTVILFRHGKEVDRIVGNQSKATFQSRIAKQLSRG